MSKQRILILIIILVIVIILGYIYFNYTNYNNNSVEQYVLENIKYICENNEDDESVMIIEEFYSDGEYIYYFGTPESTCYNVIYTDGTTENLKNALNNGHISISDLDTYNISYGKRNDLDTYNFD